MCWLTKDEEEVNDDNTTILDLAVQKGSGMIAMLARSLGGKRWRQPPDFDVEAVGELRFSAFLANR